VIVISGRSPWLVTVGGNSALRSQSLLLIRKQNTYGLINGRSSDPLSLLQALLTGAAAMCSYILSKS